MKNLYLLLFFFFVQFSLKAQNVNLSWVKSTGGNGDDQGNSIITDRSGNVYTAGYFTGRVDFDPGKDTFYMASFGSTDAFVSKFDDKGNFLWAVKLGGAGADQANSITSDTAGNLILTGSFQQKGDFDPGSGVSILTAVGKSDLFVCKLNSSGTLVWAESLGGKGTDAGHAVAVHISGNIFITGYFDDTIQYTVGASKNILLPFGGLDILICTLDAGGKISAVYKMGGSTDDAGNGITVDNAGNFYLTGYFTGKANLATGSTSSPFTSFGDADIFVTKLDGKGSLSWSRQLGGKDYECANDVVIDGSGNVYTTGVFKSTTDFDPGKATAYLSSNGDADIFVSKLTSAGNYDWAKQVGGGYPDAGNSLTLDGSGNVYITGSFQDQVDFDPGTSAYNLKSAGNSDVFVLKLNSSAGFIWAKTMGGGKNDLGFSVHVNSKKSVFTTGSFNYRGDFDPESDTVFITSNGGLDAFYHKMAVCSATSRNINASSCYNYTLNGNTYDVSGTYTQVLVNAKGCDSVITLQLTIYTTTFNYLDVLACKSYTLNGQTYTSAGVYQQQLKNKWGCDSIIVLDLSFGESSRTMTTIACDSYSLNGKTYTKTGTYVQTLKNKVGCDSTLTLKLTVKYSSSGTLYVTSCDNYTLLGKTYNSSGVYHVNTKNHSDCDSAITLNLTITQSTSQTINKTVCDQYTLNGQTYAQSGVYHQNLKNVRNCDSAITLNLQVNNTSSVLTQTACKSYRLNNQTYLAGGTYQQTIPNAKGCDSLITLNLTLNTANVAVKQDGAVLSAITKDAVYQWLDCNKGYQPVTGQVFQYFLVKESGTYAVKVTENQCTDTSLCLTVNFATVKNREGLQTKVWPNPFTSEIHIATHTRMQNGEVRIYDLLGELILERKGIAGDLVTIDLGKVSRGIYVVETTEDGVSSRTRLIKE